MTFTNGVANVQLSDTDKVVFTKIAEGTKYTVEETDSRVGTAPEQYTVEYTNDTGAIAKTANSATVTNTSNQEEETPTGILINNLPYIALALVAIGGLCAYVIVRRKADDEA